MKVIKLFFVLFLAMLIACDDDNDEMEIVPENEVICEENGVTFSATGQHGENILRDANSDIDTLQTSALTDLSLSATTTASCTIVEIVLKKIEGNCNECWFYVPEENKNWTVSAYSNNSQTFTSSGMDMNLWLYGFRGGIYEIEYYVNDSLSHSNYLQSFEDDLVSMTFLEDEFMYKSRDGGDLLYTISLDAIGNGIDSYYGTLDLGNPAEGVNNKFVSNAISSAMDVKDGIVYYFDFEANQVKSMDIRAQGSGQEIILSNVLEDVTTDNLEDMVFDGDMLYLGISEGNASGFNDYYVGRIDTSADNPTLEVIISEFPEIGIDLIIKNNVLYSNSFFGGNLTTVNLADDTFPVTTMEQFFGEGFIVIRSIAVSETYIYYATDAIIGRINLETKEKEVLVQTNFGDWFYGLHLEDNYLLFSEPSSKAIYKYDL